MVVVRKEPHDSRSRVRDRHTRHQLPKFQDYTNVTHDNIRTHVPSREYPGKKKVPQVSSDDLDTDTEYPTCTVPRLASPRLATHTHIYTIRKKKEPMQRVYVITKI